MGSEGRSGRYDYKNSTHCTIICFCESEGKSENYPDYLEYSTEQEVENMKMRLQNMDNGMRRSNII